MSFGYYRYYWNPASYFCANNYKNVPQFNQITTPSPNLSQFGLIEAQVKCQIDACHTVKLAVEQSQKSVAIAIELLTNAKAYMNITAKKACVNLKKEIADSNNIVFNDHEARTKNIENVLLSENERKQNYSCDSSIIKISDPRCRPCFMPINPSPN